jgi:hypothetical protein
MSKLTNYLSFPKAHPALFVNPPGESFTILLGKDEIRADAPNKVQELEAKGMVAKWTRVGIAYQVQYLLLRDAVCLPVGMVANAKIFPTLIPEFECILRENEIIDGFTLTANTRAKLQGPLSGEGDTST